MIPLPFYIVDVFAEDRYTGNQLAVFTYAEGLDTGTMQAIAREINFSETTFIVSRTQNDGGYDVRIFTPNYEIPFAGHPTLGTAYILQQKIIAAPVDRLRLNLKVGQIPVTFSYQNNVPETLWMQQIQPEFGAVLDPEAVMEVLDLELIAWDRRYLIQEVSTGLPMIIVPLNTLEEMKRIRVNQEKYYELIEDLDAKAIYVFCPQTYHPKNDLNTRMFAYFYGIAEDPATGSAAGCLAAYLSKYSYFQKNDVSVRLEQGHEIKRPSLLYIKAKKEGENINILVGGRVIPIARGEFI